MFFGFWSDLSYDLFIFICWEEVRDFSRVQHVVDVLQEFFNYNLKVKQPNL